MKVLEIHISIKDFAWKTILRNEKILQSGYPRIKKIESAHGKDIHH